jgi:hypothetical protein
MISASIGVSIVLVRAGDPPAHAIPIAREWRRPTLSIAPDHSRLSRDVRKGLAQWEQQHAADHDAYKLLARSKHGRTVRLMAGAARQ